QVLAADRVSPGDDEAVAATLQRLAATLDLAVERLAPGDDERGAAALRSIPLGRLFRAGVTMIGKVRRLALAVARGGPFGRRRRRGGRRRHCPHAARPTPARWDRQGRRDDRRARPRRGGRLREPTARGPRRSPEAARRARPARAEAARGGGAGGPGGRRDRGR